MSQTVSASAQRPYGLARVCKLWRLSRATAMPINAESTDFAVVQEQKGDVSSAPCRYSKS